MTWISDAISPGEIDALRLAASQAWSDDTQYPRWNNKNSSVGGGQCYVTAVWLTERLGGFVGKKGGHFAWLSPDKSYVLDVTGNHSGTSLYEANDGYKPYETISNKRTETFSKRANLIFNNLEGALKVSNDSLTGDAFPGQEPQRQNDIDAQYLHDEPDRDDLDKGTKEYNFFYANGSLEIAPTDLYDHDSLSKSLGVNGDHQGPMSSGSVIVTDNTATWEVHSNVDLKAMARIFRDYSDQVGWKWGGLKDVDGRVVSKVLEAPEIAKVLNYVWSDDHLYIGKTSHAVLALDAKSKPLCGTIEIVNKKARITPAYVSVLPQIFEWANDLGFKLYAGNNKLKRHEDLEQENLGKPDGGDFNPMEGDGEDDTPINPQTELGVEKCPICEEIFPDWHLYEKHRRKEHGEKDSEVMSEPDGGFPELNMDQTNPPHFTEQQPTTMPVTGMVEASRVDGFDKYARAFNYSEDRDRFYVSYIGGSPVGYGIVRDGNILQMIHSSVRRKGVFSSIMGQITRHHPYLYSYASHKWQPESLRKRGWVNTDNNKWVYSASGEAKDLLENPIPFIYDIPADTVTIGHPGQRTSDIPGKFTPAGIVEGMYEPGGTVNITTMTTMPYAVNHILSLWYYQYPEFSVKRVNLVDTEGKKTKLANA